MSTPETEPTPIYVTLISGTLAGIGATILKQPLERLKWLRQVSSTRSELGRQINYFKIFKTIISKEGIRGLFRGTLAGISRNVPHSALTYTIYPKFQRFFTPILYSPSYSKTTNRALLHTVTGGVSAICSTIFTHPLDTLRVRIAVQFENIQYPTYTSLIKQTMKNEGLVAFYRGITTTCMGSVFRGGVGFGIYETLKSDSLRHKSSNYAILDRLSLGMMAGTFSTVAAYPLDTVRRRMQVWGVSRKMTEAEIKAFGKHIPEDVARSGAKLFVHILRYDGILGFYRGITITLLKTPWTTAISLTLNDVVKKSFGLSS